MAEKSDKLGEFQKKIGYTFKDEGLLRLAFTHSSYANEKQEDKASDYERLEFLGDAVLELSASDYLYRKYADVREGELTKKRASMVCEPALYYCAKKLGIGEYLFLGKGEEAAGGRERDAILADVMESVAGAIYLDSGYEAASDYIRKFVLDSQEGFEIFHDSKTVLQEIVQAKKLSPPEYRITGSKGPEHRRVFICEVLVGGEKLGEGEGSSKKGAEQNAARYALMKMKDRP